MQDPKISDTHLKTSYWVRPGNDKPPLYYVQEVLYSNLLHKIRQDFLDIQYCLGKIRIEVEGEN